MAAQTLMATIQTLSPPTLCSSSSSSSPYLRQVFCCYGKYNSLSQRWNVGALSTQGLKLFGFTHLLKSKKRRTFICAVNQDAEEAFKKTVEVDRLIDRLRDTDPKELQKLVVENILAFNKGFWIRLAARTDTCKSEDYKKHYEKLTISVRGILDRLVHKTNENIESSTGIFKEILKPVVMEEEEITWPPRGPVAIIKMENEIAQRQVQVDEVFFSEVNGELRQAIQATLATKTLLTSEEATIAAASAEAVTLAKAAVKVAKDAALLFYNDESSAKAERTSKLSSDAYSSHFKWSLHMKTEVAEVGDSEGAVAAVVEDCSVQYILDESDDVEPIHEELERLREQLFNSVAVRSRRQRERKAKRTRAAEKAAANVVSVKSGSISKKKRTSLQEVDHSDPLRYLRATTSTSRLLTATEEIQLSEGIQDLLKLEKLQEELAKRCGSQPTFAQWAAAAGVDQKNLRKRLNYGILCKDKMIKSNIRLVISIAKNYQGAGMNLPDLVQEGCRGLVRGAEKFDASKGFKFSTYAHWWIKQAVHKSLSDQSRIIRLPFHMVEASYKVKEARKQLYSENGRQPDDEEIAEATGLSMKRLAAVLLTPKAPRSLEQKIGINQSLKPSEVIADPDAETLEDVLSRQFMRQDLEKVLDSLNPREKQVIRWRFGMEDGRMKTLQEIGEIMRVSRERIRQIESCAFRKLKNRKRIKNLQQYLVS